MLTRLIDEHGQGIQIERFKRYRRLLFVMNRGHRTLETLSNMLLLQNLGEIFKVMIFMKVIGILMGLK